MAKRKITPDIVGAISEFFDVLGCVPRVLMTEEVVKQVYYSWERELQREDLDKQQKQQAQEFIKKLSERSKRRRKRPILDNMIPLNFEDLFENVSTAFNEESKFF